MDFITVNYEIIDGYVLASVVKNMQLVAEMRFYPGEGKAGLVAQKDNNFVYCSDEDMALEIFNRANEFAKEHKLINEGV